ncbi:PspC domain-containing protein [Nocardioides panacisoli]|uniref:PspC domain-containing protein n=1 Tax=Nocardioides panacisoli TaxID=627624 RepID=UPI001C62EC00|nr:PspC domain-containing protein [Nocardioides panacisoli]QYJ02543.1 PspC domain-containing protein [Nocardioides panacisoli]
MSSPPPGDAGTPGGGPTATPPPPPPPGPRVTRDEIRDLPRLRRSASDRKVAGVAGGIARHLDIDPVVVRIAFVVLVFFGGGGLLLYGACWLFVPEDRTHQAVVNVDGRSRATILVVAGGLAALAAVGDTLGGFGFPWPLAIAAVVVAIYLAVRRHPGGDRPDAERGSGPDADAASYASGYTDAYTDAYASAYGGTWAGPEDSRDVVWRDPRRAGPLWFGFTLALAAVATGVLLTLQLAGLAVPLAAYPAVVVAACGVMLLVGAFYGRAGGLVPLGLLAAIATLVLSVSVPLSDSMVSVGQTRVTPERLSQLEDDYAVGMGEIKLDLTEVDLDDLDATDRHDLDLDLGIGHVQVLVPASGLAVQGEADIVVGEIKVFGDTYSDSADRISYGEDDWPVLHIDADGRIGQIEIITPEDLP